MASIQAKKGKNGKKTYYVVVSLKGRHKWVRAGTHRQAKILRRDIEALQESQKIEKLGLARRDKRIDNLFCEFLEYVAVRTSPNTLKRYKAVINAFLAFLNLFHPRLRQISQIEQEHIEQYQLRRLDSVELKAAADGDKPGNHKEKRLPKPQTVNYEVGVLRSAFLWAKDRELISSVPTRKVKKLKPKGKREPIALTPPQYRLLLKTARSHAKENSGYRVYAHMIQFVLNSGLRSGELCSLTWDDIDLETGLIKIQPKPGWTPKTYAREFYLSETCLGILRRIKDRKGYVFRSVEGGQITTDMLRNAVIKIANLAGLKGFTRPHDLRHTYSTQLQIMGVDIATAGDILGHENAETTRIYSHTYKSHLKRVANRVAIR